MNPWLTVDVSALKHNLDYLKKKAPQSRLIAVIKANAYGHGLALASAAFERADAFAVARLEEGIQLSHWTKKPILILTGPAAAYELEQSIDHDLQWVIHHAQQWAWAKQCRSPLSIWIKLDTGMHRLGFLDAEFKQIIKECSAYPHLRIRGLISHLACADQPDHPQNQRQIDAFIRHTAGLNYARSLANSAALLSRPDAHFEWVRPGLSLYGISPFQKSIKALQPAMNLYARIIAIKTVPAGGRVGYGGIWQAKQDHRIAILNIGYGDGYPRQIGPGTCVLLHGQKKAVLGRVSMDSLAVDIQSLPQTQIGDSALLWGKALPIESIAAAAGTIPYTLLISISHRVERFQR